MARLRSRISPFTSMESAFLAKPSLMFCATWNPVTPFGNSRTLPSGKVIFIELMFQNSKGKYRCLRLKGLTWTQRFALPTWDCKLHQDIMMHQLTRGVRSKLELRADEHTEL